MVSGFSAPRQSVVASFGGPPAEVRGRTESRQLGDAPRPVDRAWKAMVCRGIGGDGEGAEVAAMVWSSKRSSGLFYI
jgi:hypothetical protein